MGKQELKPLEATPGAPCEYTFVTLRHSVEAGGVTYPAGSKGVIVHRHPDGRGYEVEFESPGFAVITLTGRDMQPGHG